MNALEKDLIANKMMINGWYSRFALKSALPLDYDALFDGFWEALLHVSYIRYCSLNEKYFYYFEVSDRISYDGIIMDSIQKIKIEDITSILWQPNAYSGTFTIEHTGGRLKGMLSSEAVFYDNFKSILRYLQYTRNVPCRSPFCKPANDI